MAPRSEREKMLAGKTYTFLDPDLVAERRKTRELLWLYNRTESESERQVLLGRMLGEVGHDSLIEPPFYCTYGKNTYLGDHVYLNASCVILDNNEVRVGRHVMIGPAVQIYTAAHPLEAKARDEGWEVARPIAIGDSAWIGGGAIILPGVTIGANAVVGAGAVVTRDVAPGLVVAGNPAKVIRRIESPG